MKRYLTLILLATAGAAAHAQEQQPMKLWYDSPAKYFEESLPIGNGKMGALVYGGTEDNLIYLNDITMWTGKPVDHNEDAGAHKWIPEIRKALFDEDYKRADSLQLNVQGHNSQYYQPLGLLHIYDQNKGATKDYYRELDIDSALCRDHFTRNGVSYTREYFASNPDKVIAIRLKAGKEGAINCNIVLKSQIQHRVKGNGTNQLTMTGHAAGNPLQSIHYCTILKAETTDGKTYARDSLLRIQGATEATLYIVNATSFNGADKHPVTEAAPYLEQAADDAWHLVNYSYEQLRDRHVADYRKYYSRFKLNLGGTADKKRTTEQQLKEYNGDNRYIETLYMQYGRYLLISCSRTPGVPANLQGLWTPHKKSPWRGNYTMNINLEENYWPSFVANLTEMAEPLNGFIQALAENGRHTAKHYYGIENGWCASHNSDIWAMTNPVGEKREKPEWANWNMGGAWLVNALWERYLFTQEPNDLMLARQLMKGAADFCLDWLIENPKKPGELITAPSTSPENEYKTDEGYHGMTCYGGTADLAIIRELLINTQQADKALRSKTDARYQQALDRLHPYTIGRNGDLNEWYYDWDDWDPQHRHQSHLIGLYPGSHLADSTLMQACAKTLEQKGDNTTGWSTGWRINLWARLKNAQQAYHIYRKLLTYVSPDNYRGPGRKRSGGTYPNLFDAHPPFQIDGNFGGTAGVCEMLIQSHRGEIELLPALPAEWKDGSVSGICARGGYEISMTWKDGRIVTAAIKAKKSGKVAVSYNGKQTVLKIKAGKTAVIQ